MKCLNSAVLTDILHICILPAGPLWTTHKGPSIYDVHTEGEGVRLRWTGMGGSSPCGRPHRKLKLESTDDIGYCLLLMQRSWRLFYQNFVFGQEKSGTFSAI